MIFKVHWIIDGLAEIEAETKEQAEKNSKLCKSSDKLMKLPITQSIQVQHIYLDLMKK